MKSLSLDETGALNRLNIMTVRSHLQNLKTSMIRKVVFKMNYAKLKKKHRSRGREKNPLMLKFQISKRSSWTWLILEMRKSIWLFHVCIRDEVLESQAIISVESEACSSQDQTHFLTWGVDAPSSNLVTMVFPSTMIV